MTHVQQYEYAGFIFNVKLGPDGKLVDLEPALGQARAAAKDKHRRAAMQCYRDDYERPRRA